MDKFAPVRACLMHNRRLKLPFTSLVECETISPVIDLTRHEATKRELITEPGCELSDIAQLALETGFRILRHSFFTTMFS